MIQRFAREAPRAATSAASAAVLMATGLWLVLSVGIGRAAEKSLPEINSSFLPPSDELTMDTMYDSNMLLLLCVASADVL